MGVYHTPTVRSSGDGRAWVAKNRSHAALRWVTALPFATHCGIVIQETAAHIEQPLASTKPKLIVSSKITRMMPGSSNLAKPNGQSLPHPEVIGVETLQNIDFIVVPAAIS
ncbi:MAG: hypothetical protein R3C56_28915 [Pirellulaceae bacterium]